MSINKVLIFSIILSTIILTLSFNSGNRYKSMASPKEGTLRVACIGDSITYGSRIKERSLNSYPSQLQNLLGEDYYVRNFGASGHTLMNSGDKPYISNKSFQASRDFNPDIVIIMLGTNDAKAKNWTSIEEYIRDYTELISYYKTLSSDPKIFIMTPPKAFALNGEALIKYDISNDAIDEITFGIKKLADSEGISLIDLNATISNHPEFFTFDGIHPDAKGASYIAETVYKSLRASN